MSDSSKFQSQVKNVENKLSGVSVSVPNEDKLKGMSDAEIEALKDSIRAEFAPQLKDAADQIDRLKKSLEMQETLQKIDRRGEENETAHVIKISQRGPLGPVDQHGRLAEQFKEQLKGKKARFVTTADETLNSIRRGEGYKPVLDEEGNEVRYIDGTLMAMPEREYEEKVAKPKRERAAIHRSQIKDRFENVGKAEGVETSVSIKYDTH